MAHPSLIWQITESKSMSFLTDARASARPSSAKSTAQIEAETLAAVRRAAESNLRAAESKLASSRIKLASSRIKLASSRTPPPPARPHLIAQPPLGVAAAGAQVQGAPGLAQSARVSGRPRRATGPAAPSDRDP
eukprot:919176-Prymnesium_polylepis.1